MANPDHVMAVFKGQAEIDRILGLGGRGHLDLRGADLRKHAIQAVTLVGADIRDANLEATHLSESFMRTGRDWSIPKFGNLVHGYWTTIRFVYSSLDGANFRRSKLRGIQFKGTSLVGTDFAGATFSEISFSETDLTKCHGLETVDHEGPSSLDQETLVAFGAELHSSKIEAFLRGCGYHPWQVIAARLNDPRLNGKEIANLADQLRRARSSTLPVGGIFISYAHDDASGLAEKLYERLQAAGTSCWLDRHDMKAGKMTAQVERALRNNDILLVILSEAALRSDWVEHELRLARRKEKDEQRDVLCPVALDGAWRDSTKTKSIDPILWEHVMSRNVIDFSKWTTAVFDEAFLKLWEGLGLFYPRSEHVEQHVGTEVAGEGAGKRCASCSQEIPAARLRAMPTATLCVKCQADAESPKKPESAGDCPKCGSPLLWKQQRDPEKTTYFLACSAFPECWYIDRETGHGFRRRSER